MANKTPRIDHIEKYQFKPGCAPGPGRPKQVYTDAHGAVANMKISDLFEINKKTGKVTIKRNPNDSVALGIAKAIALEALKGKVHAALEAADRTQGKSIQALRLTGPDDGPVEMTVSNVEEQRERARDITKRLRDRIAKRRGAAGIQSRDRKA